MDQEYQRFQHQHSAPKPPMRFFLAASVVMFFLSLSAADSVGFVPCSFDGTCGGTVSDNLALSNLPELGPSTSSGQANEIEPLVVSGVEPERIAISSIGLDLPVQNP